MQMFPPATLLAQGRHDDVFAAKAATKGGIVRRAVLYVESEIGKATFVREVRGRGFHLIESGGQYIVICTTGQMQIIC
jgi:hypothetical protein